MADGVSLGRAAAPQPSGSTLSNLTLPSARPSVEQNPMYHSRAVVPAHVRWWDYNREVPAVEGKIEGDALHVMLSHRGTHSSVGQPHSWLLWQ